MATGFGASRTISGWPARMRSASRSGCLRRSVPRPGNEGMVRRFLLGTAIASLFLITGCGYHIAGRSNILPPDTQTIAVPAFVNRSAQYRIEQRLTEAVVSELLARTHY